MIAPQPRIWHAPFNSRGAVMQQRPATDTVDVERDREPSERRVVVGIDGSSGSQAALRWAIGDAATRQLPVHALMCSPTGSDRIPHEIDDAFLAEAIAERGATAVTVTASVVQGRPAHVLLDAATDADLLVVGSRGHGAVVGTLIGSVSHFLVTHAPCVVVVVPDAEQLRQRRAAAVAQRNSEYDESVTPSQADRWTAMRSKT
jgi:nucleotide-binding universal stress UspA family protein